jgi:hypothetical protein
MKERNLSKLTDREGGALARKLVELKLKVGEITIIASLSQGVVWLCRASPSLRLIFE